MGALALHAARGCERARSRFVCSARDMKENAVVARGRRELGEREVSALTVVFEGVVLAT